MTGNSRDRELRERARKVIPNGVYGHQGTRLLPPDFPQFFASAAGCRLWDVDGNELIDLMCAYGPNLLGYADPEIDTAYTRRLAQGDTMTGPGPEMVELAEALTGMVAHADWAIFCKNGTDATSAALMVARAATGRRRILVAERAYHGAAAWATPLPAGTTAEDRAHLARFRYNDCASLEAAVAAAGEDLAAILVSPFRHDSFADQELPSAEFARRCRSLADRAGALLILDEVRTGFRLARGCSWTALGVAPDLSAWGKALANGHALSVLLGNQRCRAGADAVYVTGSFWFQAAPMAAALVTLKRIRESDYLERTERLGALLRQGLDDAATAAGFRLRQTGPVTMPQILFAEDPDFRIGFAWASAMLARGVYVHPWHNMFLNGAMTEADIQRVLDAAGAAFAAVGAQRPLPPNAVLGPMLAARGVTTS